MKSPLLASTVLAACAGRASSEPDPGPPCVDVRRPMEGYALIFGIVLDERGLAVAGVRVQAVSRDWFDEYGQALPAMQPPPRPEQHIYSSTTNELGQYWMGLRPVLYDVRFWSDEVHLEWKGVLPELARPMRLDVDLGDLPADDWNLELDASSTPTTSTRARECPYRAPR